MVISKCPDNAEALKISIFLLSIGRLRQTGCSPSFGRYGSCGLLKHDHKEMASQADGARFMAAALS